MQIINYKIYVDSCYYIVHKFKKSFFKKVIIPGALTYFSQVFFKHFGSKNQLPGLSIIGTLLEIGLKRHL